MRVFCLNNYPLEKMWRLAERGEVPGQHVWGVDALVRAGHTVEFAPFLEPASSAPLHVLSRWSRQALGQLDQEQHALASHADVIYCADGRSARGLALLPHSRRPPLVMVLHHPVRQTLINRAVMRGTDVVLSITEVAMRDAIRLGARDVSTASWGPDLESPLYAQPASEALGIVSAGKSNRDLATLVEALRLTELPATIYDLDGQLSDVPPNVRVVRPGGEGRDPDAPGSYLPRRVIADMAQASIVAIPVWAGSALAGLTEVNDALALGKPIIMTKVPSFPLPLELARVGVTVEPGDVAGWVWAFSKLGDPDLRRQLGHQARRLAETGWNYESFCAAVVSAIKRAPI